MKKLFLLTALALGLFLLAHTVLHPAGSSAMPMPQEETPVAIETPVRILTIEKKVAEILPNQDDNDRIDPGDTIRYTISYSNTSESPVTNVILVDDYDEQYVESVTGITGGGSDSGKDITWDLGDLAGREGDSVSYQLTLRSKFPPGSVNLANTAIISSTETRPLSAASPVLVHVPDLTIRKGKAEAIIEDVGAVGVVDGGDTIKYVITYE